MSLLKKYWFKYTDKKKYYALKAFKEKLKKEKKLAKYNKHYSNIIDTILQKINDKDQINFKHSGHLGDIVYALPVIKELSKSHTCNLYIHSDKPMPGYYMHPSGNVILSKKIILMFIPLLQKQDYLNKVDIWNEEEIDIDLDIFRDIPLDFSFLSQRWYFHIAGVQTDLNQRFIDVPEHEHIKNKVVIVRSFRARNYFINYNFLEKYDNLLFIGIREEYEDLKKSVKNLEFYDVKDFYEMAQIIKSSKFFLGNQSFAYSLAESLKVPRLLEGNPDFSVVFPVGDNAYDFFFQQHFELYFDKLFNA